MKFLVDSFRIRIFSAFIGDRMSLGWKTLLRAICISALAAVMVSMPVSAAKKTSHGSTAVQRHAPVKQAGKNASVKAKGSSHGESRTADRHSQKRGGHDRDVSRDRHHSRKADGRSSSQENNRSHRRHDQSTASDRRERRHIRRSRRHSRHYSYQSDFSGADYASTMTADVVSKPATASHSYTPRATDIAMTAMSLIGTPYRYGGNSPLTGLDCSGFVKYVYKETLNTNLPRTAAEMSRVGQPVSRDELKPGDLVFYNTMRRSNSHVGIYLGDGRFIHSPRTGQRVRINSMDESYWRGRFNGARRIIGGEGVDRAKVLQQYSREADTTPDTYNYDEPDDPGEPPRERSVSRHHTERTLVDTRKPADDAIVQETVAQEPSHNGDQEVSHERRSRHRGVRHQERASRHHHDAANSQGQWFQTLQGSQA